MAKKFFELPRLVQIILLIIPIVGWIVELIIRWSAVLEKFTLYTFKFSCCFNLYFPWLGYRSSNHRYYLDCLV